MKQCVFCSSNVDYTELINKALYIRYQEYPFNLKSPELIRLVDNICYEEDEEYFKSVYTQPYLRAKQKQLLEYYRYHSDIPRFQNRKLSETLELYHINQREIRYQKIKIKLGLVETEKPIRRTLESFRALRGLSHLQTTRQLINLMQTIQAPKLKVVVVDKQSIADLICKQKQSIMQEQQPKHRVQLNKMLTVSPTLASPLESPTGVYKFKSFNSVSNPLKNNKTTQHRKMITQYTEQSVSPKQEYMEFYRKWSNIISHRELQQHRKKLKNSLAQKRSFK